MCPHYYTSLNRWSEAGWIHAFMCFTPNSDPPVFKFWDSSDQAKVFGLEESAWSLASASCSYLCSPSALSHAVLFRDALLPTVAVTSVELLLLCYQLEEVWSVDSDLSSLKHFHQENRRSLDIFSILCEHYRRLCGKRIIRPMCRSDFLFDLQQVGLTTPTHLKTWSCCH